MVKVVHEPPLFYRSLLSPGKYDHRNYNKYKPYKLYHYSHLIINAESMA